MSMPEMARLLDLPRKTVYQILINREGEALEVVTVGDSKRITTESFNRWYAGQTKYLKPEDRISHPEALNLHYADCLTGKTGRKTVPAGKKAVRPKNRKASGSADFLTPGELACIAGVSLDTVYQWVSQGKLPSIRVSKRLLKIPRRDAEAFLLSRAAGDGKGGRNGQHR